jgi:alginate O-acetyltransferase complex protein AlgI
MQGKAFNRFLIALLTFFFINVTWVFFRAQDFSTAWRLLSSMFVNPDGGAMILSGLSIIKVSVIISLTFLFHYMMRNTRVTEVAGKMPWWLLGIVWAGMLALLILSQESSSSFIYFQF